MNMAFLSELFLLAGSVAGFTYGIIVFLSKKTPLYAKMIAGAVGCMMFGYLLAVIRRIAGFEERAFRLDYLTYIGVFLFLLTANAGLMDGLVDDGNKRVKKYRVIALAAPVAVLLLSAPVILSEIPAVSKICCGAVALFAAAASYFNLKHAVIPDVEFGVIHCVRAYNWIALLYAVLLTATLAARALGWEIAVLILSILTCVDMILILPMMKRGIDRWKTI